MIITRRNNAIACFSDGIAYLKPDGTVWAIGTNTNGRYGIPYSTTNRFNTWTKLGIDNVVDLYRVNTSLWLIRKDGTSWLAGMTGANGSPDINADYTQGFVEVGLRGVERVWDDDEHFAWREFRPTVATGNSGLTSVLCASLESGDFYYKGFDMLKVSATIDGVTYGYPSFGSGNTHYNDYLIDNSVFDPSIPNSMTYDWYKKEFVRSNFHRDIVKTWSCDGSKVNSPGTPANTKHSGHCFLTKKGDIYYSNYDHAYWPFLYSVNNDVADGNNHNGKPFNDSDANWVYNHQPSDSSHVRTYAMLKVDDVKDVQWRQSSNGPNTQGSGQFNLLFFLRNDGTVIRTLTNTTLCYNHYGIFGDTSVATGTTVTNYHEATWQTVPITNVKEMYMFSNTFILYLKNDGTVWKAGTGSQLPTNKNPSNGGIIDTGLSDVESITGYGDKYLLILKKDKSLFTI